MGVVRDMELARPVNRRTVFRDTLWYTGGKVQGGDTYMNKEPNFTNSSAALHLPPCICMEMPERATVFAEIIFNWDGHWTVVMLVMFSVSQR